MLVTQCGTQADAEGESGVGVTYITELDMQAACQASVAHHVPYLNEFAVIVCQPACFAALFDLTMSSLAMMISLMLVLVNEDLFSSQDPDRNT